LKLQNSLQKNRHLKKKKKKLIPKKKTRGQLKRKLKKHRPVLKNFYLWSKNLSPLSKRL